MTRTTIQTSEDGPLKVEGPVRLIDADGCPYDAGIDRTYLCRCGASNTKPFCDGSHAGLGCEARERAPKRSTSPRAETAP